MRIQQVVSEHVGTLAQVPADQVALSRSAQDHGIDSLALLVLRESIERALQVQISDQAWLDFESLNDLVEHLTALVAEEEPRSAVAGGAAIYQPLSREAMLTPEGHVQDTLEVGMPLTGLNGLAENPLLKYLGHLRWTHLSAMCGVPSKDVVDAEGHRLYPTFFYVDLQFPPGRDMATFGENDRLRVISTVERFGASMLDGTAYLLPADWPLGKGLPFASLADAVRAGVPAARLSNIFVKQFGGAEWLKKSRPANAGFERIPIAEEPPDSYPAVKAAERDGMFAPPPADFLPLTDGWVTVEYSLIPDRDLNGAGLVYFANYPLFLDICERRVLAHCRVAFSEGLLDHRSLEHRRSAYLNNASARDTLLVETAAWLQHPALLGQPVTELTPLRLFVNARMRRRSDGRLMMVSCAKKVLTGHRLLDLPGADDLLIAGV